MNYQSSKNHVFYNTDYKNTKNLYYRSFGKGDTKNSELEGVKVDFRFIVPWQMH
jgi:hypothetical protein